MSEMKKILVVKGIRQTLDGVNSGESILDIILCGPGARRAALEAALREMNRLEEDDRIRGEWEEVSWDYWEVEASGFCGGTHGVEIVEMPLHIPMGQLA